MASENPTLSPVAPAGLGPFQINRVPVNGDLKNIAAPGALLIAKNSGGAWSLYQNSGSKIAPTWALVSLQTA